MFRPLIAIVLCAVTGCAESDPARAGSANKVAQRSSSTDNIWSLKNTSGSVRSALLTELPSPKQSSSINPDGTCASYVLEPKTTAGKRVKDSGWYVIDEIPMKGLTLVSFFNDHEDGTSGNCEILDGNIAIFHKEELVGLIYKNKSGWAPGGVRTLRNMNFRIWESGVVGIPIADIYISPEERLIRVKKIAEYDEFCESNIKVPTIHGLSVTKARAELASYGWEPYDTYEIESSDARTESYRSLNRPEYNACSGTGFAFCSLSYKQNSSILNVSAAGEGDDQMVSRYRVVCGGVGDMDGGLGN